MSLIDNLTPIDLHGMKHFLPKRESNATPKIPSNISNNSIDKLGNRRRAKSPFFKDSPNLSSTSSTPHQKDSGKKLTHANSMNTEEDELQNTWKKAPKISKKLPPAFGGIFQKSAGSVSKYIF